MKRFEGKGCLVTGAASGIGAAIARRMAEEGAGVGICDINESGAKDLAAMLKAEGHRAIAIAADAADLNAMRAAVRQVVTHYGALNVQFNNAGIVALAGLDQIDTDNFNRIMTVNAYSVVAGTRAAAEVMRPQQSGKIINTCSVGGKTAWAESALYCASKFTVRGFTIAFAKELAPQGIHVNAICPGMVQTPLWDDYADQQRKAGVADTQGAALVKSWAADVALGRHAQPDDIVGLALFLASPDSDYITGQCINVDGGLILT